MSDKYKKAFETISRNNHQFRLKLYNILRQTPGNIVISSTSLEVLLVLACMGAKGKTAEEIKSALKLPKDMQIVKNGYNVIMTSLKTSDGVILNTANKIYSDITFPLKKDFHQEVEKYLLADAENVDFKNNSKASLLAINSWIERQTNNKINNLFSEGDITSETVMVMINAVYFKGKWKTQFDPSFTKKEPFHISTSQEQEVDMMHINADFGYSQHAELEAKILILPFMGDTMCMMILLPNTIDGLEEMENKLYSLKIEDLVKNTVVTQVAVSLPRFAMEKTMDLKDTLKELGMNSMFEASLADFSGINETKGAYISKIIQKAFIELNEEGSEAAAASGAVIMIRSMPRYEYFEANKPFSFLLLKPEKCIVLFQGRYVGEVL